MAEVGSLQAATNPSNLVVNVPAFSAYNDEVNFLTLNLFRVFNTGICSISPKLWAFRAPRMSKSFIRS